MKKIPSVLYVFVMLVKHKEQNIEFIVVNPISCTLMDLSELSCLPSHSLNLGYILLLKVRRSGISLPLFQTLLTK